MIRRKGFRLNVPLTLTASLPQPVKFPVRKVHPYTPANNIFDGPVTNLLSVLCIFIEALSRTHAKGGQSRNNFKFGTSIRRFPNDTLASMAVKGLKGDFFWTPSLTLFSRAHQLPRGVLFFRDSF